MWSSENGFLISTESNFDTGTTAGFDGDYYGVAAEGPIYSMRCQRGTHHDFVLPNDGKLTFSFELLDGIHVSWTDATNRCSSSRERESLEQSLFFCATILQSSQTLRFTPWRMEGEELHHSVCDPCTLESRGQTVLSMRKVYAQAVMDQTHHRTFSSVGYDLGPELGLPRPPTTERATANTTKGFRLALGGKMGRQSRARRACWESLLATFQGKTPKEFRGQIQ